MDREITDELIQARRQQYAEWRKEHNFSQFEPPNGVCWNCGKQIFKIYDGTNKITGCPFCHRTFVG